MTLAISGLGWVTPLGAELLPVWERLLAGDAAADAEIASPISPRSFRGYCVPAEIVSSLPKHARMRRSSAISIFAVAAGLAALADAGVTLDANTASRVAVVLAISNGGVIYTRRFFHDIVAAQPASPLLFPETVFNAPASHLAAILGITGASYTLVGDASVGLSAMKMAEDLMQTDALDHCLVVAAEEADWLLCDAYSRWRLVRAQPPIEAFAQPPRGMLLSEGAGAVLVSRHGAIQLAGVHPGAEFRRQKNARDALAKVFAELPGTDGAELVIASANGTFIDAAERAAIAAHATSARVYSPKPQLGEAVAAGSLWQVILGALALRTGRTPPPTLPAVNDSIPPARVLISTCGLNQQAAGAVLEKAI